MGYATYRGVKPTGAAVKGRMKGIPKSPETRAKMSIARRQPRVRRTKEQTALLQAMQLSTIDFLMGPALDEVKRIALHGEREGDRLKAFGELADRCGLPRKTVQDLSVETRMPPEVVFIQQHFERPGSVVETATNESI